MWAIICTHGAKSRFISVSMWVIICKHGAMFRSMSCLYIYKTFNYQVILLKVVKVKGGKQIFDGYYGV